MCNQIGGVARNKHFQDVKISTDRIFEVLSSGKYGIDGNGPGILKLLIP